MKVLQLIDSLNAGGAERMAVNIANALSRTDRGGYLCVTRKEGLLKAQIDPEVQYLYADRDGKIGVRGILRIKNFVQDHDIQIIHAHATSFFAASMVKVLVPHLQIVWHDHYGKSEQLAARDAKLIKVCKGFFNAVISVNQTLRAWAVKELGISEVHYLPNFAVPQQNTELDQALPGVDGKRILCLANLRAQKDQLSLVKAFEQLEDTAAGWTLHLCGKEFNNKYSERLKEYIKSHHLDQKVFLHGSRADVAGVMSHSDIGVLSSLSEGLPLALLEYGLYGLPVIATRVGACEEVIGENGLLVAPGDVEALSQALDRFITDRDLRNRLSDQFQKKIVADYGEEQYLAQLLKVYKKL